MNGRAPLPTTALRLGLPARPVVPALGRLQARAGQRPTAAAASAGASSWQSCRRSVFAAVAMAGTVSAMPNGRRNRSGAAVAAEGGDKSKVAGFGDDVMVRYTGKFEDGKVFEDSGRNPVTFQLGEGMVPIGFENAVLGMAPGDKKEVTLPPDEGYGQRKEELVITVPKEQVPQGLKEGMQVNLGGGGQNIPAFVQKLKEDGSAILDCNSPLAGQTLTFDIELVGIKEPEKRGQEPEKRGQEMIGWGGKKILAPNAIAGSRESEAVASAKWPQSWPYTASDFKRQDESDDVNFYDAPRFVTHIDDGAIGAIRTFYAAQFAAAPQGEYAVLDLCSSWVSHYPQDINAKRVAVTGMNEKELEANKQATEHATKNLNVDPKLPYGDNEFDFITNVVSVDYLNKPKEIFQEMHRVMKPGGVAIMSFSNRCFGTKAIAMWLRDMSDGPGHCKIIGSYFHFCPDGGWKDIQAADISPNPGRGDPMWVVTAVKA